jgi:hypothetical protein
MASAEQTDRRRPALWQPTRPLSGFLLIEVIEYLLNHHRVFDAGNDLHGPAAGRTGLNVDAKDAFQALRPGHGGPALSRRWWFIGYPGLVALAPFGRGDQGAMFTVRRKHAVESCQVHSGLGHQGGEPGHEIQRLEDDVRGAITVRCLELVTDVAIGRE